MINSSIRCKSLWSHEVDNICRRSGYLLMLLVGLISFNGCGGGESDFTASEQSELRATGPIRLAYGPDPLQFGHLRTPGGRGRHPVAVVIHGGSWSNLFGLDFNDAMSAALTEA